MNNMYEIFIPIKDYEDTYAVSNLGNVKNIKTGKILKPFKNNHGYMHVNLFKNGEQKMYKVHRLVLSTFKANPERKPQINHIDEDKTNNTLNNLEWCDAKYNANYGTRTERAATKNSIPVYCITNDTVYKSAREAARKLNLHSGSITHCCNGKRKSTGGYQFKYYTEGDLL